MSVTEFNTEIVPRKRPLIGWRQTPLNDKSRAYYDALLERARAFADELGKAYQASDRQECRLLENG